VLDVVFQLESGAVTRTLPSMAYAGGGSARGGGAAAVTAAAARADGGASIAFV
jgi:hypothetical protein